LIEHLTLSKAKGLVNPIFDLANGNCFNPTREHLQ